LSPAKKPSSDIPLSKIILLIIFIYLSFVKVNSRLWV
jgi:hypothetical protein